MRIRRAARPRILVALAATFAVFMAPVALSPAAAHSQLISANPKDGTAVEKAPKQITLTFNEDLQDLPGSKSNQIVVTDRDGNEVTTGKTRVDGPDLKRGLSKLPAGTYDVAWSALSADGHRVSGDGNYAFTVTKGEKPAPTSGASSSSKSSASKPAPAQANSAPAQAEASDEDQAADSGDSSPAPTVAVMWVVGGFLVLAILLGIILQVTRKKPSKSTRQE